MSTRKRRRKRKKIIRIIILAIVFLILTTSLTLLFLKSDSVTNTESEVESVEMRIVQSENVMAEEHTEMPQQITVEETEPFGTIDFIPIDAEDTYISDEIQTHSIEIGEETGYCPEFLMAIIEAESSGRQYAENGPCKGLMQINTDWPEIAEYMKEHGYTDIYDYETNIRLGCYVLDQKRGIFGDDIYAVLMGYNGSSNVVERVQNEDYSDYAIKVVNRTWELEKLHGK